MKLPESVQFGHYSVRCCFAYTSALSTKDFDERFDGNEMPTPEKVNA